MGRELCLHCDPVVTMGSLLCSYGIIYKECIITRTIREMLGNEEKVWVYLNSKDTWKQFVNMAVAEGFQFGDLPVERWDMFVRMAAKERFRFGELPAEKWKFSYVVSVHSSGDMGHLPLFVWCRSFEADTDNCPKKVDFRKFTENGNDYYCLQSRFYRMTF